MMVRADLSCPECGGPFVTVNIGRSSGTAACTIVMCDPCGMQYELSATLHRHGPRRPASHRRTRSAVGASGYDVGARGVASTTPERAQPTSREGRSR